MAQTYAFQRKVGTVSEILQVFNGNTTTGVGLANVVASTVGFAWYRSDMSAISTGTCTTGTLGTYTVSSWVQANSTGMLGWYDFGIPDGVFASGRSAAIRLSSALMAEINIFIELTKTDNQTFFSSQVLSSNALVNVNQILGSAPVTSVPGMYSVNVSTILGSNPTTNAAGVLSVDLKTIFGSAPVTTAAGVLAAAWDLGRTANLTSTIALPGTSISTNQLVNVNQILGSTPVTSAAGILKADLASIYGTPPVTTAAGVQAVTWDLGRTANLTSTIALTGTSISTNILVALNQIFGSAPVTTSAGVLSVGISGFNPALVDASVSSRLAAVAYTAPLTAAGTRTAVGLSTASLDARMDALATSTQAAAIQAKTDNLPSDPADQSLVIAATDAVMTRLGAPAGASVSADVAAVKGDSAAVKAKTDSLTFTTTGMVDANIRAVKDSSISGDGSVATPWGP